MLNVSQMRRRIIISVLATILNVLLFYYAAAETINIPADYSTIQEGINAAIVGDTVLVQPGTYVENINYYGKNITVASLFLMTQDTSYISQTIIDGNENGSVVIFDSEEDSTAVLTGFKITNGYADGEFPNNCGGGILCFYDSSPKLINLRITRNSADFGFGGGIYCEHSFPYVEDVMITENTANYGGGIHCRNYSSPSLKKNRIINNSAYSGGGIYCEYSYPNLENVTISENSASIKGGGVYCCHSDLNLLNSIISENNGNYGIYYYSGNPIISYSNFYNNEVGNFYGLNDSIGVNVTTNANGDSCDAFYNIQMDPLFVDPVNNGYHLSWAHYPIPDSTKSPCIDAGDPNSPPDPDGTITDMGAFYFNQGVSIDEPAQPTEFNLTNYPNPISSDVNNFSVSFSVHRSGEIKIQLFNVRGQLISTLINKDKNVGEYTIAYPVKELLSGIYFTKMSVDGVEREIRKVVLLR